MISAAPGAPLSPCRGELHCSAHPRPLTVWPQTVVTCYRPSTVNVVMCPVKTGVGECLTSSLWGNSCRTPNHSSLHPYPQGLGSGQMPLNTSNDRFGLPCPQRGEAEGVGLFFLQTVRGLHKVLGPHLPCWVRTWTQMVLG
ncbi:hypothetical protein ACRRTK_008541 [Alexandromys fortis]